MSLIEECQAYELASKLVSEEDFHVLYMDTTSSEIWLEKKGKSTTQIIRIINQGFDWKNHLKKDIAQVLERANIIQKKLKTKALIYNVYLSSYGPVDDWTELKQSLQFKGQKYPKLKTYYLTPYNNEGELSRLQADIGIIKDNTKKSINVDNKQAEIDVMKMMEQFKSYLSNAQIKRQEERKQIFSYGKPFITYILIIFNVFMFIILELNGGSTNTEVLIKYGAKYNPDIINGEWWRIIASTFLHIGVFHLFMNMLALYYLGSMVERIFGTWRFSMIYLLSGIGGGLASFALTTSVSAGASGAIFGLFGALLFFGTVHKTLFLQTMGSNIIAVVGLNLIIGLLVPNIDMGAHLGGLVTGYLASGIFYLPNNKNVKRQISAFVMYFIIISGLIVYGMNTMRADVTYQIVLIEEAVSDENFNEVINLTTEMLNEDTDYEEILLFQRAYGNIYLGNIQEAIDDLEKSVKINENYAEAYYNLTLLYAEEGQQEKAIRAAKKAYQANPDDEAYIELYEQMTDGNIE